MEKDFTSLRQLRQQLPRMSALEAMAFEPELVDTISLDEACNLQLADESITQILPEAIVSQRGAETYITLLEPLNDKLAEKEEVDEALIAVASISENVNGKKRTEAVNPIATRNVRNDLFPASNQQGGSNDKSFDIKSPHNNPINYDQTKPQEDNDDIAQTIEELNKLFAIEEAKPVGKDIEETTKPPSKLFQIAFRRKCTFDNGYYDIPGGDVPRRHILLDRVKFVHKNKKVPRTPRSERYRPEAKVSPLTKKLVGAIAVGAFALTSIGVASGISNSQPESVPAANRTTATTANHEVSTKQTKPITRVMTIEEIQAFEQMTSHPVEFDNLIKWTASHPGEDFDAAYQQAFGA